MVVLFNLDIIKPKLKQNSNDFVSGAICFFCKLVKTMYGFIFYAN